MGRKQLVLHGQKEFVDSKADSYVLVEPYLEYTEIDQLIEGKLECLKHPFETEEDALAADEYITELSERMIRGYGKAISKYAGFSFNDLQFTTVLCEWFRGCLNDLYYRYKKMAVLKGQDIFSLGILNYGHEPALADSMRNIVSDFRKNAYLWSYVADKIGISVVEPAVMDPVMDGSEKKKQMRITRRAVRTVLHPSRVVKHIKNNSLHLKNISSKCAVLLYETILPFDTEAEFCERSDGRMEMIKPEEAKRENLRIIGRHHVDLSLRKKWLAHAFGPKDEFEKIAHHFMLLSLPVAYFEAAKEMYKKAREITKSWNLEKIYSSYTSMELMDYCFALVRVNGTKIYGIQHSGAYGGSELAPRTEMVFSDTWCSWGWEYKGASYVKSRIKPLKMIRLPKYQDNHVAKKDKILWACNCLLAGNIGRGWNYSDYMNREMELIDALSDTVRDKIVLRIDGYNLFNKKFAERVQSKYKNIKIENRYDLPFSDSARESKFVICDYHGSPDLESLLLGVPVVLFRADANTVPGPNYKDSIKELRKLGIYSDSPKELAGTLNKHKGEIAWLDTKEAREAYGKYLKTFTGLEHRLDRFTVREVYDTWFREFIN